MLSQHTALLIIPMLLSRNAGQVVVKKTLRPLSLHVELSGYTLKISKSISK